MIDGDRGSRPASTEEAIWNFSSASASAPCCGRGYRCARPRTRAVRFPTGHGVLTSAMRPIQAPGAQASKSGREGFCVAVQSAAPVAARG